MTAVQRKSIFGLSKGLNMDNDNLHDLVFSVTGCESLKDVSDTMADSILRELRERMRGCGNITPPKKKQKQQPEAVAGMITSEQQSLAWRLVYRLQELDTSPSKAAAGERMAGAIQKELGITTAAGKDIFKWVSFDDGSKLIEKLKRYVRSAERRVKKEA